MSWQISSQGDRESVRSAVESATSKNAGAESADFEQAKLILLDAIDNAPFENMRVRMQGLGDKYSVSIAPDRSSPKE